MKIPSSIHFSNDLEKLYLINATYCIPTLKNSLRMFIFVYEIWTGFVAFYGGIIMD